MKNGPKRFEYFLNQLQVLLAKSSRQKNPALWLYQNNARTPLFMLEGLAKLYAGIHNKKKFTKLKEHFKLLEDGFGAIDYYDSFAKEFAVNKKIPVTVVNYLQAQTREKIQSLNETLIEKRWVNETNSRISTIREKLSDADWLKEKKEMEKVAGFYRTSIDAITEFTGKSTFHYNNVESDLHELRRKLRWLSIYPQALKGSIQLSKASSPPKYLQKYLTKEITSSPFNIMPDAAENQDYLLLEKNYFFALSWMIAELGKLKDKGLRVIAIKEALQQTSPVTNTAALKKAYRIAGPDQLPIKQVLLAAEQIGKNYFREKCLQKLVIGTVGVKQ